jgi:hypothetical protein
MGAKPNDFSENYLQADFDTLEDRKILMHFTPLDTIFASTCIFRINNTTVTVTLPQSTSSANVVVALEYYTRLMRNDLDLKQKVRIAQFQESKWDVSGQCLNVHYL